MIKRIILICFLMSALSFIAICLAQDPVSTQGMTPSDIQKQAEEAERQYQDAERQWQKEEEARKNAEEARINADSKLVRELEDLEDQKRAGKNLKGSCDIIAKESTCIEFYGSVWAYGETMKTSCQGNGGVFSKKPCPRDFVGGCNAGNGLMSDMVSWFYYRGNGGFNDTAIKNARKSCNAGLGARWIQVGPW